jgi:hypothetical protein
VTISYEAPTDDWIVSRKSDRLGHQTIEFRCAGFLFDLELSDARHFAEQILDQVNEAYRKYE